MDFKRKKVLVVGGGSGIGAAIAIEVANLGAEVAIADLSDSALHNTGDRITAIGGIAHTVMVDVADDASVASMAIWYLREFGPPDLLIVTVVDYGTAVGGLDGINVSDWKQSFNVNFFGYIRVLEHLLPAMRERGSGAIVLTSSTVALLADPTAATLMRYKAIKHALLGLSQSLAVALGGSGLKSISFCPSLTATPNAMAGLLGRKVSGIEETIAGAARAEDVARLFVSDLRNNEFLICAHPGYRDLLVDLAERQLDPLSYIAAHR